MDFMRARVTASIKASLARRGLVVCRPMNKFGMQAFTDIKRLAGIWNYPMHRVFDVGANHGDTAVATLSAFAEASTWSFEPHPATFARLVTRLGGHPRFRAANVALSNESGVAEMFEYDEPTINSLIPNAQYAQRYGKTSRTLRVPMTTVDAFCQENSIDRIDLLKIDTEGFDLVVLEGCKAMLQNKAIRFIYVEFNDIQPKDGVFGGALAPFDDLLHPHGYRFVASYNDYIETSGEMFSVSNALFALPASSSPSMHT